VIVHDCGLVSTVVSVRGAPMLAAAPHPRQHGQSAPQEQRTARSATAAAIPAGGRCGKVNRVVDGRLVEVDADS
jgi:hypothetical protein